MDVFRLEEMNMSDFSVDLWNARFLKCQNNMVL